MMLGLLLLPCSLGMGTPCDSGCRPVFRQQLISNVCDITIMKVTATKPLSCTACCTLNLNEAYSGSGFWHDSP